MHIKFNRCPYCGSVETVGQKVHTAGVLAGWRKPTDEIFLRISALPLQDTAVPGKQIPLLMRKYDMCATCGVERVMEVEIKMSPVLAGPKGISLPR